MNDLLNELRHQQAEYPSLVHAQLCGQAADEIERLRAILSPSFVCPDCNLRVSVINQQYAVKEE